MVHFLFLFLAGGLNPVRPYPLKKICVDLYSKFQQEFKFAGDWAPMCPSPWKPVLDVWSDNPILPKDPR